MVTIMPEVIALSVALLAVIAEVFQWRRLQQIRFLAFGPKGKPAVWTAVAPVIRVAGIGLACWGFASLWLVVEAQVHNADAIDENDYKHLVLIVDVSPSMGIKDAGPDGDRSRRQRASDVLDSLFQRVPMRQFKVTIIAVYTDAKMLLEDSKDHEVVRHIIEEMPMWHAFKPGKTKLMSGIQQAAKVVKTWNPKSTYILMLTDGDSVPPSGMPVMPPSVAEFIVVGVGDPNSGTFIDDHLSRQDVNTLRQVSNRLRGTFHNGNTKHLSSKMVDKFVKMDDEDKRKDWTRREWSLLAAIAGSFGYAMVPILLHYFGTGYRPGVKFRG